MRSVLQHVIGERTAHPAEEKKELNSEIWGKGVCDIWEKWVAGWRNKIGRRIQLVKKEKRNQLVCIGGKRVCGMGSVCGMGVSTLRV